MIYIQANQMAIYNRLPLSVLLSPLMDKINDENGNIKHALAIILLKYTRVDFEVGRVCNGPSVKKVELTITVKL